MTEVLTLLFTGLLPVLVFLVIGKEKKTWNICMAEIFTPMIM